MTLSKDMHPVDACRQVRSALEDAGIDEEQLHEFLADIDWAVWGYEMPHGFVQPQSLSDRVTRTGNDGGSLSVLDCLRRWVTVSVA